MNVILTIFVCAFILEINFTGAIVRRPSCPIIRIANGRVRYRQKSGFAQFICNKSYLLAGDKYMKCVFGEWEGETPVCVRNTCKAVRMPKYGFAFPAHRGGVFNFYCMAGYELNGPSTIYCDGKKWNNYFPSCIETTRKTSLNCDFEHEDLCGWTHDINHDFDWIRLKNSTPSWHVGTGPSYDHTLGPTGEGYYMYIESTSKKLNDTARLISPVYRSQENNTCLEFYYHMHGITMGELRVYLKKFSESFDLNPDDAYFTISGNQGNEWKRSFVNLGTIDENFQIIMEGVRGSSYLSDIAIDDVKIIENCVEELEESTITDSTTDTTEESFEYESCMSRCGLKSSNNSNCDCDSVCILTGTCCVDFIGVCILSEITSEENDEDYLTTDYSTFEMTEAERHEETTEDIVETTTINVATTAPDSETTMPARIIKISSTTKKATTPQLKLYPSAKPKQRLSAPPAPPAPPALPAVINHNFRFSDRRNRLRNYGFTTITPTQMIVDTNTAITKIEQNVDEKPNTTNVGVKSNITNVDVKPKITNVDVQPKITNVDVKPKITNVDVKPNITKHVELVTNATVKLIRKPTTIKHVMFITKTTTTTAKTFILPKKVFNITKAKILPNYKKSYSKNKTFKEKENDFYKQDMLTVAPNEDDDEEMAEIFATTEKTLKLALLKTEVKKNEVVAASKTASNWLIYVVVGVGLFVVVVGMVCVVKRRGAGCRGIRRRNGSYGDSASDVRFLTSDEVLDFRLATPY